MLSSIISHFNSSGHTAQHTEILIPLKNKKQRQEGNEKILHLSVGDFLALSMGCVHRRLCPREAQGWWDTQTRPQWQEWSLYGPAHWLCWARAQLGSVTRHLRGLPIGGLVSRLNEHGLCEVLARWHGDLLDLVQLLQGREGKQRSQRDVSIGQKTHPQNATLSLPTLELGVLHSTGHT